jgi:outer membrane autotransporter protein
MTLKKILDAALRTGLPVLSILAFSAAFCAERAGAFPSVPTYPTYGSSAASSPNQGNVAGALSGVQIGCTAGFGGCTAPPASDMLNVVNRISALPAAQQQTVFSQLAPRQMSAMIPGGAAPGAAAQTGAVSDRLAQLRSGDGATVADALPGQPYPGTLLADGIGDTNLGLLADPSKKWGTYGALVGAMGRQYGDANGPGYSFNGEGFSAGADYRVAEGVALGVSGGLLHTHASVDQGAGTTDGRSYKYGAYGTAYRGGWYADAYFGGGLDFFTTERSIPSLGRLAGANPQGHQFNMKLGSGYDVPAGRVVVTPFASISHDRVSVGPYAENGAGSVDLNVSPFVLKSTKGALGFRLKRAGDHRIKPYISMAYQHEFEPQGASLTSQFTGGGQTFATALAAPSQEAGLLGVGADARVARNVSGHLSYDGEYRFGYVSHSLNANLRLAF